MDDTTKHRGVGSRRKLLRRWVIALLVSYQHAAEALVCGLECVCA